MVEEIKNQVQYFNKVLTLFIIILVIMSVVIASLIFLKLQEIGTVKSLDNVIRDSLQKYGPDREKQQISRDLINDTNSDVKEIKEILLKSTNS